MARPLGVAAKLFAALVGLRLLVALAPAEPLLGGVPLGIALELGVMAASTVALRRAARAVFREEASLSAD